MLAGACVDTRGRTVRVSQHAGNRPGNRSPRGPNNPKVTLDRIHSPDAHSHIDDATEIPKRGCGAPLPQRIWVEKIMPLLSNLSGCRRRFWQSLVFAVAGLCAFVPPAVEAQSYPNRPIRLLHGFAVGGAADTLARIVSEALAKRLGQPVIVEAKSGAGGNIAAVAIANSPPDGYNWDS